MDVDSALILIMAMDRLVSLLFLVVEGAWVDLMHNLHQLVA